MGSGETIPKDEGAGIEKVVADGRLNARSVDIGLLTGTGGTKTGGGLLKTGPDGKTKLVGRVGGGEFGGVVDVLSRLDLF